MGSGNRRQTLSASEVVQFARIASARKTSIADLASFTWWPAPDVSATEVKVRLADGTFRSILFRDIVADTDGVFYFGWDVGTRNAVWKWVPAFPDRRNTSTVWVTF